MADDKFFKAVMQHGQTLQMLASGGYSVGGQQQVGSGSSTLAPNMMGAISGTTAISNTGVLGDQNSDANKALGFVNSMNPISGLMSATQNNFSATGANLQQGTNGAQIDNAYNQAQGGIGQQQDFYQQLAAQNGIGNQSSIYNQYQNMANGVGPNAAQAQLANSTGANVSNQAAMMAGQRGSNVNAGLMARQAAMQGANTQQQAAGQGAALQAQQSQAALGAMSGIAQNQVNQQGQALTGYNTAVQNEQNVLQNANSAYNSNNVTMQSNLNNVNGQISQGNQSAQNGMIGNMMNSIGSAGGLLGAKGGMIKMAEGGEMPDQPEIQQPQAPAQQPMLTQAPPPAAPVAPTVAAAPAAPAPTPLEAALGAPAPVGTADVGTGAYVQGAAMAPGSSGSMGASPDMGAAFKQDSGGGGGGGGMASMLPMLMMLADGGTVNFGGANYAAAAPVAAGNAGQMGVSPDMGAGLKIQQDQQQQKPAQPNADGTSGPQSMFGKMMGKMGSGQSSAPGAIAGGGGAGKPNVMMPFAQGGQAKQANALVSPGEKYLTPEAVKKVAAGADPMKEGVTVPGKPKVAGAKNSYANDTVPAKLEEGGIVIPRSITQGKHPGFAAKKFVDEIMKKNKGSK